MTSTLTAGDVHSFDFQADVLEGEYKLVRKLSNGRWLCEHLAPSEALIERAFEMYSNESSYRPTHATEDRRMTADEAWIAEIDDRIECAGSTFEMRFVSAAAYAENF